MNLKIVAICALTCTYSLCFAHEAEHESNLTEGTRLPTVHIQANGSGPNPWTNLLFNNEDGSFQFAIVTDRTGGHRAGVFEDAINKLNLLQPEFVMSVGDLIEGYTNDEAEVKAQWDEFDSFVSKLKMPFFYLAGNHDMSNAAMADVWQKRLGKDYYDFRYNDVLFVVLNSNEHGNVHHMSDEQVAWLKNELEANQDVSWTLLFIHAPLWDRNDQDHWPEVEELMGDRDFTAFAGHNHNYILNRKGGHKYFTLATTGGASSMRGIRYGEFDHVVWVTMRKTGPIVANLMLDGIWPEEVSTKEIDLFQKRVLTGAFRFPPILFRDHFHEGETVLRLTNDSDVPTRIKMTMKQVGPVLLDKGVPSELTMNPNDVLNLPLKLHAGLEIDESMLVSELTWSLESHVDNQDVVFNGTSSLILAKEDPIPEVSGIVVDGHLKDWPEMQYKVGKEGDKNEEHFIQGKDLQQSENDASFAWSVARKDGYLYLAAKIKDDQILVDPSVPSFRRDHMQIVVDARPKAIRINNQTIFDYSYPHGVFDYKLIPNSDGSPKYIGLLTSSDKDTYAILKPIEGGYILEMSIPESKLNKVAEGDWDGVRVNVIFNDLDAGQDGGATILTWHRPWMYEGAWPGSGCFYRR